MFRVYPAAGKWGKEEEKKNTVSPIYYSRYPSPLSYFTSEPQLERSSHSNIHSFKDRDFNFFVDWSTGGASSYIVDRRSLGFRRVFRVRVTRPNSMGKEATDVLTAQLFTQVVLLQMDFQKEDLCITYERCIARSRKLSVKNASPDERTSFNRGARKKRREGAHL